eukprot:1767964-Lingulodinium_polyedra.AAC.1
MSIQPQPATNHHNTQQPRPTPMAPEVPGGDWGAARDHRRVAGEGQEGTCRKSSTKERGRLGISLAKVATVAKGGR